MTNNELTLKKIKIALIEISMNYKTLASSVGMTQQGLRTSIKNGSTKYTVMAHIAKILNTDINYLINNK